MDWKYKDITEKIIGAAMKVHSILGNGFPEIIYQRALALQLQTDNIAFIQECNMPVYYLNQKIGDRRVDFLVEQKICVALKAMIEFEAAHFAQAKNYLEAFNLEVALLINFGVSVFNTGGFPIQNTILYYSIPTINKISPNHREETFTIPLRAQNALLRASQRNAACHI